MAVVTPVVTPIASAIASAINDPGAGGGVFSSASVFVGGHKGVLYYFNDKAKLTGVVNATDLITTAIDQSGNGYTLSQAGAIRPAWNNGRAEFSSGDFMKATGVDLSGTNATTMVAAAYFPSGAGVRYIAEHGSNAGTAPGVTLTAAPFSNASGFGVTSRGTALASANNHPNSPKPLYAVVTGITRTSTDTCVLRANGVVAEVAVSDQGTGSYQNADLYLGAGALGTNFWFSEIDLYAFLLIDKELTEVELNNVEKEFAAMLSGVTIGSPKFTLVAIGDSYTYAINGGVIASQAYVEQLNTRQARIVKSANLGASGNSTSQLFNRRRELLRLGTPNMAIIYGSGSNDPPTTVAASPTPTASAFGVVTGQGSKYAADGQILVGGVQAQISTVVGDTITLTAPRAGGAPAVGTAVVNDTEKNITELVLYLQAAGCTRNIVLGLHYFNTATGADTTTVEVPANAALRAKQQAAAAATGAVYVDLYAWQKALIIAGTRTQGNYAEHVSSSDAHLSLLGQTTIADAIEATIIAQGWT